MLTGKNNHLSKAPYYNILYLQDRRSQQYLPAGTSNAPPLRVSGMLGLADFIAHFISFARAILYSKSANSSVIGKDSLIRQIELFPVLYYVHLGCLQRIDNLVSVPNDILYK